MNQVHPQDEGFASDRFQQRIAFAQGYKAKGKGKKEEVKEKLMNALQTTMERIG